MTQYKKIFNSGVNIFVFTTAMVLLPQQESLAWTCPKTLMYCTLIWPPERVSVSRSLASTTRLMSRWRRRPKSRNIVEPPDSTILLYNGRLTSIGQFWITLSTMSEIGRVKSGFENCTDKILHCNIVVYTKQFK